MKDLISKVVAFRDERGWREYHQEKDLAISISLEASELLENFQWRTSEEAILESKQNIKEEMADILIYLVQVAIDPRDDLVSVCSNCHRMIHRRKDSF
jgi:NTP pyrophosphatase (non-canonical NTP hydrolase)